MPAYNTWGVSYSLIRFLEEALTGHKRVSSFQRINDIQFLIRRFDWSTLNVVVVNEYALGLAAVLRARKEFPGTEYVVTGATWNGYTPEAKKYGQQNDIGIFNLNELFGALHWTNPKQYSKKDDDGNPTYEYKDP
jgi:hypothetical protein